MIAESLYEFLTETSSITTLTSRIYPTLRPLHVDPPFITYTLDADERQTLMSGSQSGYKQAIFSIDCYDLDLNDAIAIADAVESALIGFIGSMGDTDPVTVDHVRLERRGPHLFESDTNLHRVPLEFMIGYED